MPPGRCRRSRRAAGCTARTTLRRIDAIDLVDEGETLAIDVRGNAFLRNMVRIVVGTLVEVLSAAIA